ncbi:rod shape-determining protein MreC [Phenylobacterium sp.]|uniref:rod shape-determining protein MreC n=1 Tax=Phenylobacterium sp. TaxID=1871053 RepID=UPI000C8D5022|nr:rod shape-determining protein MreC [Phenylobacterium sp.]MAK82484.1 rod shape-determining protein MreC [Phenylobacterium sp.]
MSFRDNPLGEIRVPLVWTAGVALVVAVIVAVTLLLGDRRETLRNEAYGVTREVSDAVAAPVSGVVSAPVHWLGALSDGISQYFFAVSENRRLRAEAAAAAELRQEVLGLRDLNERYRDLLGLQTDPPIPMVSARVVSDSRGPFANTRLANAGRERQVRVGNPVMTEYGLVGRVVGVTRGASRVLLLTDIASRTPVMVDRTNARAILAGDGGPNPKLEYLRGYEPVKAGDRIVTSGDGGLMPRGLPVGVAVKGVDGAWRVVLSSEAGAIDFVRILLFEDFAQLVDQDELNTRSEPPADGALPTVGVTSPPPPTPAPTPAPSRTPAPVNRPPPAKAPVAKAPTPKAPAPKTPAAKTTPTPRPAPNQPAATPAPAPPPVEEPVF